MRVGRRWVAAIGIGMLLGIPLACFWLFRSVSRTPWFERAPKIRKFDVVLAASRLQGNYLWLTAYDRKHSNLYLVDVDAGKTVGLLHGGSVYWAEELIYYDSRRSRILCTETRSSERTAFSPLVRWIFPQMASTRPSKLPARIWSVDANGSGARRLVEAPDGTFQFYPNPDGRTALLYLHGSRWWRMDLDTLAMQELQIRPLHPNSSFLWWSTNEMAFTEWSTNTPPVYGAVAWNVQSGELRPAFDEKLQLDLQQSLKTRDDQREVHAAVRYFGDTPRLLLQQSSKSGTDDPLPQWAAELKPGRPPLRTIGRLPARAQYQYYSSDGSQMIYSLVYYSPDRHRYWQDDSLRVTNFWTGESRVLIPPRGGVRSVVGVHRNFAVYGTGQEIWKISLDGKTKARIFP